jgi:hypothetical protein
MKTEFRKTSILLTLLASGLLMLSTSSSCRRCTDECDPNCKNYDPCCGQVPPNASFKIYEILQNNPTMQYQGYDPEDVATDTIVFINTARFYADFEADYYEWRIDGDNRTWNTREFVLNFSNLPFYQPAEVTLKVYRAFDKSCHPNAQDTAVFKRTLYTVPFDSTKVLGVYTGYLQSNPNANKVFSIKSGIGNFNERADTIAGIIPYCETNSVNGGLSVSYGYKSFFLSTQGTSVGCCYGLSCFGFLDGIDELKMKVGYFPYNPQDSCNWSVVNDSYITDFFEGQKL